jgi:hypothetical protein
MYVKEDLMEATVVLRETPCRMRLRTRRYWRSTKATATGRIATIGEHATRAAILDKAAWSLSRVRVPW